MWPFKKERQTAEETHVSDAWTVARGDHNGRPMYVRYNGGFSNFKGKSRYGHQVGIAVPLKSPENTGLPSSKEIAQLGSIEDTLCEEFEAGAESLFAVVVTTSGMQEFVFYTRCPEQVKVKFEKLRSQITSHEIQLMIQEDRDWHVFDHLTRVS